MIRKHLVYIWDKPDMFRSLLFKILFLLIFEYFIFVSHFIESINYTLATFSFYLLYISVKVLFSFVFFFKIIFRILIFFYHFLSPSRTNSKKFSKIMQIFRVAVDTFLEVSLKMLFSVIFHLKQMIFNIFGIISCESYRVQIVNGIL